MNPELRSILTGTAGLTVAALVAAWLTVSRDRLAGAAARRAAMRVALAALLLQAAHFAEELATGFSDRFPRVLGLVPWPVDFFVSFNVFWLIVWLLGCAGLATGYRVALFPLWFLALGCLANGVAHPLLALGAGGYFPGLFTSPLVGVAGVLLLRQLLLVTGTRRPAPGSG